MLWCFYFAWLVFRWYSVRFMSCSLWPHGLQHARLPLSFIISPSFSNSCPLSWWCHPTISSSVVPFSSCLPIFPSIRVFSNESVLHSRWPKYCSFSFSISPSNEYSGLTSFKIDWFDVLAIQKYISYLMPSMCQDHVSTFVYCHLT